MAGWRVKPLRDIVAHAGRRPLKRTLGALDLTLLGVGSIVGAGVFVLIGVAAQKAGPAVGLAFVLAGVVSLFAALAYAEMAAMAPVAGGAYTFAYASLGEALAWLVGWNLILELAVSAAAVASGWSGYVVGLAGQLGLKLPAVLATVPQLGGIADFPAMLVVLAVSLLLAMGTRRSALLNSIMVLVKIAMLMIFLWLAAPAMAPANWQPFLALGWFERISGGETIGVLAATAIVFFAYVGVHTLASAAEEARRPNRDLPLSLLAAVLLCVLVFAVVGLVSTGVVRWFDLSLSKEPLALVLRTAQQPVAAGIVAIGALAGLTAVLLTLLYGLSRLAFVMARDGLLPPAFAALHGTRGTPHVVTLAGGVVVALVAGLLPLDKIVELSNIGTLFAFLSVAVGALVLRRTHPEYPRPFRCPALPLVAALAILGCGGLMLLLPLDTWWRFVGWSLLGAPIYLAYGRRRSSLAD